MKVVAVIGVIFAALAGSCLLCLVVGALTDEEARTQRAPTPAGSLDGQYVCVVPGRSAPGGVTTADVTLDMTLNISGHTYEGSGGDGSVGLEGNVVRFSGGGYDGWRGLLDASWGNTNIVFAKDRQQSPDGPNALDSIRCTRRRD